MPPALTGATRGKYLIDPITSVANNAGTFVGDTLDYVKRIRIDVDPSTLGMNIGNIRFGVAPTNAPRQFWTKSKTFNGNKVFQRDDLINPKLVDKGGVSNLQRMQQGRAPIGPDGKEINLHHLIQTQDGAIAEVTQTFHQQNYRTLHINIPPNQFPSGIDRNAFNAWKRRYWMDRANDFGGSP